MADGPDPLLAPWEELIERVVAFEYDCSFEWRGETDGGHDSYLEDLNRLEDEASEALARALASAGPNRARLLEEAAQICRRRKDAGGWGAKRCWSSIIKARELEQPVGSGGGDPEEKGSNEAAEGDGDQANPPTPHKPYKVYVDDNGRPDDPDSRYLHGEYQDCEAALRACRKIVDDFLKTTYSKGTSFNQMWTTFTSWGEDPFIVGGTDDSPCSFSAWDFARQRIREVLEEIPSSKD